jgi:hypothetical protein
LISSVLPHPSATVISRAVASDRSRRRKAQMAMPARAAYSNPGQVSSANAAMICAAFDIGSNGGATSRSSSARSAGHPNSRRDHRRKAAPNVAVMMTEVRLRRPVIGDASRLGS